MQLLYNYFTSFFSASFFSSQKKWYLFIDPFKIKTELNKINPEIIKNFDFLREK